MSRDWYKELEDAYAEEANKKWRRERKRKIHNSKKRKKRHKGQYTGG